MENDYTDQYNTQLSDQEQDRYDDWTEDQSAKVGRDVSKDTYDYDLQGWWQKNQDTELSGGHLTDQWKKPNHPTFSDQSIYHGVDGNEGGTWGNNKDGSFFFAPGPTNLKMTNPEDLQDYFNKVEPGNSLLFQP